MRQSRHNLVGKKFGSLTVENFSHTDKYRHAVWNCLCDCGGKTKSTSRSLNSGNSTTCGCSRIRLGSDNKHWKGSGDISASYWKTLELGAKKRDLSFDITIEQAWEKFLAQERKCALSGVELSFSKRKLGTDRTASLDRINPNLGYTLDNSQWVHKTVNFMKQDYSESEFLDFVEKIYHFKVM